jgi:hypothetical protein
MWGPSSLVFLCLPRANEARAGASHLSTQKGWRQRLQQWHVNLPRRARRLVLDSHALAARARWPRTLAALAHRLHAPAYARWLHVFASVEQEAQAQAVCRLVGSPLHSKQPCSHSLIGCPPPQFAIAGARGLRWSRRLSGRHAAWFALDSLDFCGCARSHCTSAPWPGALCAHVARQLRASVRSLTGQLRQRCLPAVAYSRARASYLLSPFLSR